MPVGFDTEQQSYAVLCHHRSVDIIVHAFDSSQLHVAGKPLIFRVLILRHTRESSRSEGLHLYPPLLVPGRSQNQAEAVLQENIRHCDVPVKQHVRYHILARRPFFKQKRRNHRPCSFVLRLVRHENIRLAHGFRGFGHKSLNVRRRKTGSGKRIVLAGRESTLSGIIQPPGKNFPQIF